MEAAAGECLNFKTFSAGFLSPGCSFLWSSNFPRKSSLRELLSVRHCRQRAMIRTQQIQEIPWKAVAKSLQLRLSSPLHAVVQFLEDASDAKLLLRGISATVNRVFRFFASTLEKTFQKLSKRIERIWTYPERCSMSTSFSKWPALWPDLMQTADVRPSRKAF